MATVLRATSAELVAMAAGLNDLKAQIGPASAFHLDKSERTITAANATDLPTALVLCNQIIGVITFHFADLLAHKAIAASTLPALGAAIDLASAITAANLIKASHNTECASTARHYTADATNTTTSPDASDLASLETLLNEIKSDLNAHMASGPAAKSLRIVPM